jgi:hypothetical protein
MNPISTVSVKNEKRVTAGRINGYKRRPWTDEERECLRAKCLQTKPWLRATGPKTPEGKAIASANGRHMRPQDGSARSLQATLQDVREMLNQAAALRESLMGM